MARCFIKATFSLFAIVVLLSIADAMKNPAAVYCEELGYTYKVQKTELGDLGLCVLPNGKEVDAWKFLEGKDAQEYSYCKKHGYEIKTIMGDYCLERINSLECAVCIVNGEYEEVTEIMGLSFEETICGDGVCGLPENYKNCPTDCPSGSYDLYCDCLKDGICDPDCKKTEDPDCTEEREVSVEKPETKRTPGFEILLSILALLTTLPMLRKY